MATTVEQQNKAIIKRLDQLLFQNDDATAQVENQNASNMQLVTSQNGLIKKNTSALASISNVLKSSYKATSKANQALFKQVGDYNKLNTDNATSLRSIVKSVSKPQLGAVDTPKVDFKRSTPVDQSESLGLLGAANGINSTALVSLTSIQDALHSALKPVTGASSSLTVGYMSGLFAQMQTHNDIIENRKAKDLVKSNKENSAFQRTLSTNTRAFLVKSNATNIMAIYDFLKLLGLSTKSVGAAVKLLGSGALAFGKSVGRITGITNLLGGSVLNLINVVKSSLTGFGLSVTNLLKNFLLTSVRNVFFGIGRALTVMMNPVVLIALLAGYSIYKIFEDEIDGLFTAMTSLFSDPAKRELIMKNISDYFSGLATKVGEFFNLDTFDFKDLGVVGETLETAINGLTGFFGEMKTTINKIIGAFSNIPKAFKSLGFMFDGLVLTVGDMIEKGIRSLRSKLFLSTDEQDKELAVIAEKRKALDIAIADNAAAMKVTANKDVVGDTAKAIKDVAKAGVKAVVDAKDSASSVISGATDSINQYSKGLDAQLSNSANLVPVPLKQSKAMSETAKQIDKSKLETQRQQAVMSNSNQQNNISNTSIQNTPFVPMQVSGSAKITQTDYSL